ncbi:chloride channel protein [Candidatus Saccharibacteria bacterium]|nr:chloride channel protein [Candidatus Saccharibacteria bacterium]
MNKVKAHSNRNIVFVFISVVMGTIVGFLYLGFEWLVNNGSNWLWNDLVQSDTYRWRVIPLAIVMSIALTGTIVALGKKRVLKPSSGLLDELSEIKKTSIKDITIVLIIGALSLLAGASLGPEASLVAASMGTAAWLSGRLNALKQPVAFVLSISSIGALLAAFFNSLLPVFIPILLLKQKNKLNAINALIVILSGVSAWSVVRLIKDSAYIQIPVSSSISISNVAIAALLGFLSIALTVCIKWTIEKMFPLIHKLNAKLPWLLSASIFGLVLGLLYFIGGQSVQFSGSEGLKLLSENVAQYSAMALLGLILVKLLSTSWSITTGYRGGLVFPSIYMGVALSLATGALLSLSKSDQAGAVIGAVTGVLMGMINPIVSIILALALFPSSLMVVVASGALGALIGLKLFAKLVQPKKP